MLRIAIPGRDTLELAHLVCDLNGTLAVDGVVLPGVAERLAQLSEALTVHILTAGTHGGLDRARADLAQACAAAGVVNPQWHPVATGADKERYVTALGAARVAALGNGANDDPMFQVARLSIAVIGAEGVNTRALLSAHVAVTSPRDALDLLLNPMRLVATLRT